MSYVYSQGCTGPLKIAACILQLYYPPQQYDLITFLLDTFFYAAFGYGLILFAGPSYHHLAARLVNSRVDAQDDKRELIPNG